MYKHKKLQIFLGILTKYVVPLALSSTIVILYCTGTIKEIETGIWLFVIEICLGIIAMLLSILIDVFEKKRNVADSNIPIETFRHLQNKFTHNFGESVFISVFLAFLFSSFSFIINVNVLLITALALYVYLIAYLVIENYPFIFVKKRFDPWLKRKVRSKAGADDIILDGSNESDFKLIEYILDKYQNVLLAFSNNASSGSLEDAKELDIDEKLLVSLSKFIELWFCNEKYILVPYSEKSHAKIYSENDFFDKLDSRFSDLESLVTYLPIFVKGRMSYKETHFSCILSDSIYEAGCIAYALPDSTKTDYIQKIEKIINQAINEVDNNTLYDKNSWTKEQREEKCTFYIEILSFVYEKCLSHSDNWFFSVILSIYNKPQDRRVDCKDVPHYFITLTLSMYLFANSKMSYVYGEERIKISDFQKYISELISKKEDEEVCWWCVMKKCLDNSYLKVGVLILDLLNLLIKTDAILSSRKINSYLDANEIKITDKKFFVNWWYNYFSITNIKYPYPTEDDTFEKYLSNDSIEALKQEPNSDFSCDEVFNFFDYHDKYNQEFHKSSIDALNTFIKSLT